MEYSVSLYSMRDGIQSHTQVSHFGNLEDAMTYYDDIDLRFEYGIEAICSPCTLSETTLHKDVYSWDGNEGQCLANDTFSYGDWTDNA